MNYNQISTTLNIQLKGLEGVKTDLTSGLRLAVYALAEEFQETDPTFDRLQFEFDCFKHTEFSDGGRAIGERASFMMS